MNEKSEDIVRRIKEGIDRIVADVRSRNPIKSDPPKIAPIQPKPAPVPKESGVKPDMITFGDKRLNDALAALKAYGYDEKTVMRFLNGLELNQGTSVNAIIKMALEHL